MGREARDTSERNSTRSQGSLTPPGTTVEEHAPTNEMSVWEAQIAPLPNTSASDGSGEANGGLSGESGGGVSTSVTSVSPRAASTTTDLASAKRAAAGYPSTGDSLSSSARIPPGLLSAATTDQISAKFALGGYNTGDAVSSSPEAADAGVMSITRAPDPPPTGSTTIAQLPDSITSGTTPLAFMRTMDEKAMYREDIEPMPTPTPNSISLPGAFSCHSGHSVPAASQPQVNIASSVGTTLSAAEGAGEDVEQPAEGAAAAATDAPTAGVSNNPGASATSTTSPTDASARHLPIAAELAEDHEESRLQEIEDQLRREFEERVNTEYVRRSHVHTLVEGDMDASANSHCLVPDISSALPVAEAAPVLPKDCVVPEESLFQKRKFAICLVVLVVLLATVIGLMSGVFYAKKNNQEEEEEGRVPNILENVTTIVIGTVATVKDALQPVLQSIRERGYLKCKGEFTETRKGSGFTIDLCRAISAAIFNDPDQVEYVQMSFQENFEAVAEGLVDVSADQVSLNMGRDVSEYRVGVGFAFSTPYIYTGTALAGQPNFVRCAVEADTFDQECRQLQVCVIRNTVTMDLVEAHLPGSATKLVAEHSSLFEQFADGICNVVAGDAVMLHEELIREAGYEGEYTISDQLLSREHLALMTRQDDPEWATFVDWIVRALITAEALNITQETAHEIGTTDLFGPEYENMFVQAIATVGNYGELYDRHYGEILKRTRYNSINKGGTGLIVSDPLGTLMVDDELAESQLPKPVPNGTMEAVIERGLRCGVMLLDQEGNQRPGFAEYNSTSQMWSGIDVAYCRGLASSVWNGEMKNITFVNLSDPETRYTSLANGTVDVIAGESFSMITGVKEPTTGQGFTFATPYFYYNATTTADGGALALLTSQDDPQWSDLANWVTHATFYAEEHGITRDTASKMAVVELFGMEFRQMLRDVILAIGNYGEIYQRNLESTIPRGGRNLLNSEHTPQFYPVIPFLPTRR